MRAEPESVAGGPRRLVAVGIGTDRRSERRREDDDLDDQGHGDRQVNRAGVADEQTMNGLRLMARAVVARAPLDPPRVVLFYDMLEI
jgi:hypothetical protein